MMPSPINSLLKKIKSSAENIAALDLECLKVNRMDRGKAEEIMDMCAVCLANLDTARKAGINESTRLDIHFFEDDEPKAPTLHELQLWCSDISALATEHAFRSRIQQALLQANVWMSDLQDPTGLSQEQVQCAIETGNCLLQVIRTARAAGLSNRVRVELNAVRMTLLATETLDNYVATTGCELLKKRYRCGEEGRE